MADVVSARALLRLLVAEHGAMRVRAMLEEEAHRIGEEHGPLRVAAGEPTEEMVARAERAVAAARRRR